MNAQASTYNHTHAALSYDTVPTTGDRDRTGGCRRLERPRGNMRELSHRVLRLLWLHPPGMAEMQVDLRRLPADQQELRRPLMNGYNFTERVRHCLRLARDEAAQLRHDYIGTEHL